MKTNRLLLAFAATTTFLVPRPASAAPPSPGQYRNFHDIDEVKVAQTFQLSGYGGVAVPTVDTRNAPLPEAKDNSYPAVKAALAASTQSFVQGMRAKLPQMKIEAGSGGSGNVLVVRVRITKSDPGSQAARYWGGFGAGAAKVGIAGEIVDGRSGKVLAQFAQERRSGFGLFGGGYRDLLDRSMRQIGGDVAGLLRAF